MVLDNKGTISGTNEYFSFPEQPDNPVQVTQVKKKSEWILHIETKREREGAGTSSDWKTREYSPRGNHNDTYETNDVIPESKHGAFKIMVASCLNGNVLASRLQKVTVLGVRGQESWNT